MAASLHCTALPAACSPNQPAPAASAPTDPCLFPQACSPRQMAHLSGGPSFDYLPFSRKRCLAEQRHPRPPPLSQMAEIDGQPATDLQVSDVIHKTYEKVRPTCCAGCFFLQSSLATLGAFGTCMLHSQGLREGEGQLAAFVGGYLLATHGSVGRLHSEGLQIGEGSLRLHLFSLFACPVLGCAIRQHTRLCVRVPCAAVVQSRRNMCAPPRWHRWTSLGLRPPL